MYRVVTNVAERTPALYLGHGAPPLVDDPVWPGELAQWAKDLPKPKAILVVSAHWEESPLTIGATTPVPLVYDFYGFPEKYYRVTYPQPGAPWLAERVRQLIGKSTPTADEPLRGLDHGAYVPLTVMYPEAEIPSFRSACRRSTRASSSSWVESSRRCAMRACSSWAAAS